MAAEKHWPGTSREEIAQAARRLYEDQAAREICQAEIKAKAYEATHNTNITDNLAAWRTATGIHNEALFLKWQATRRRSEWDAYRLGIGFRNYGAW